MYIREIYSQIQENLKPNKVLVLYGARRVGKTFLIEKLVEELKEKKIKFVTGEDKWVCEELSSQSVQSLKRFVGDNEVLIIDEAQKVPNIGLNLKLVVDHIPEIKVLASGSASFDLVKKLGEPLLGRKILLRLFPLSAKEFIDHEGVENYKANLEEVLIFGGYPELQKLKTKEEKAEYLSEVLNSLVLNDIVDLDEVKNTEKLLDILTMLSFQVGSEVSLSEIGSKVGLHKDTVSKYLNLLEKVFIIKKVRGFSRNLRNEVTKNSKYYFYDNGIRNSVINNFNIFKYRNDIGQLWENYIVMERVKRQKYSREVTNNYFWRTYSKKEIDWIEEKDGFLKAFEIKYSKDSFKVPPDWKKAYPSSGFKLINRDNFLEFIL
jgi:uncharacterized protein